MVTRARKDPEVAGDTDLKGYEAALRMSEQRIGAELMPALDRPRPSDDPRQARRTVTATGATFAAALQLAEEWLAEGVCQRCLWGPGLACSIPLPCRPSIGYAC